MSEQASNRESDPMSDAEKTMSAIEGVVRVLGPLPSEERHRVIQAAFVVLREKPSDLPKREADGHIEDHGDVEDLPGRARLWMKQNDIEFNQLAHVFDITDGAATVIASEVSGKNNSEKTIKAYILAGIGGLLSTGDPVFEDKAARDLCASLGCYDSTNHSKYMKEKGNNFTGSKEKGWKLTAPGLKYAATIIKAIVEP